MRVASRRRTEKGGKRGRMIGVRGEGRRIAGAPLRNKQKTSAKRDLLENKHVREGLGEFVIL